MRATKASRGCDQDHADEQPDEAEAEKLGDGIGVSTTAAISCVIWMPDELVTPIEGGSSGTQSYGIVIVAERRRPSVASPSTVYGTIASSTVTVAIVRSSA